MTLAHDVAPETNLQAALRVAETAALQVAPQVAGSADDQLARPKRASMQAMMFARCGSAIV